MIRLSWRQFRTQAVVAYGALAAIAVVLAITGPHLVHVYDTGLATCAKNGDCGAVTSAFSNIDHGLHVAIDILVLVVPGIIGIFWGAPLVARELENNTFRLVWTQSVTRVRWLSVKLGVVGLASAVVAGLISLMVTWWSSTFDRVSQNAFGTFDQRDLVPIGYAVFAFALGVTAGVLIRRTVPAMAVTMVSFVAARVSWNQWIRPDLISPATRDYAINPASMGFGSQNGGPFILMPNAPNIPGAWVLSTQIVNRGGQGLTSQELARACPRLGQPQRGLSGPHPNQAPAPPGVQQALQDCVVKLSAKFHELVSFQPGNRYWTFQWYGLAAYLGAALVLAGICIWWVRRRLT